MGQALSRWIDGSLATLEGIEAERDRHAAQLEAVRTTAASQREAIAELDREVENLTAERKNHAAKLAELDQEVLAGTSALDGLESDLQMMAEALEKVASAETSPRKALAPSVIVRPAGTKTSTRALSSPGGRSQTAALGPAPGVPIHTRPRASRPIAVPVPVHDEPSDALVAATRGPWRQVVGAALILGVLGGAGYAALQTETGSDILSGVRAQIEGAWERSTRDINV